MIFYVDPYFRQQMYSSLFDSTKYKEEMSQYLAVHPSVMQSWCNTMMNNPEAMKTMQNIMGHGIMGHGMMGNTSMNNMSGMSSMNNMSGMMHP